ncbi:MAG: putative integral rane protein [Microbacterium sp.]|nr:putative integral rane protein [Microbacterium sp.]
MRYSLAKVQADPGAREAPLLGHAWCAMIWIVPVYRLVAVHYFSQLVLAVLALAALTVLFGRVARPRYAALWIWSGFGILLAALVSSGRSGVTSALTNGLPFAFMVATLPFIFRFFIVNDSRWLVRAVVGFVTVQTISAAAGISQVVAGFAPLGFAARQGRANGFAEHPNVLALMAAVSIIICVYAFYHRRSVATFWCILALVVNASAMIATGSLSSLMALAVGIAVLLPAARITGRSVLTVACGFLAMAVVGVLAGGEELWLREILEDRVLDVTGATGDEGSFEVRQQTWAAAWAFVQNSPFVGVGMDSANAAVYGSTVTHSYLLHYWYRGGIVLLMVGVAVTVAVVATLVRAVVRGRDGVPAAVLTVIFVFAATSAFFDNPNYWIPILLAFAALDRDANTRRATRHRPAANDPRAHGATPTS